MRRPWSLGLLVSVALVAGGCGGGDDDGDGDDAGTTTTAVTDDGSTTTTAGATTTTADEGSTTTTAPPADGGGGEAVGAGDASVAAPDMTGAEICGLLPADPVSAALDTSVTATPGTTDTPQCSYQLTLPDGAETDVTVAALRTATDLEGKFGADAYTHVVELNTAGAREAVTQTPLDVGNQSVVLSGQRLHMAVLQLGGRIVTVLVGTDVGDVAAVTEIARAAAAVLAP